MSIGEKGIDDRALVDTALETDNLLGSFSSETKRISIAILRTVLNSISQTIEGDLTVDSIISALGIFNGNVTVDGTVSADFFEGDGAALINIVAAGPGGSTSEGSLSLIANSGGSTPAAKIAFTKYLTTLVELDENGVKLKSGIPLTSEDDAIPIAKNTDHNNKELIRNQTILNQTIEPYYHFDGVDDFLLTLNNTNCFNPGINDFSFGFRFKTEKDHSGNSATILDKAQGGIRIYSYIDTNNKLYVLLNDSGGNIITGNDAVINDGEWHNVIFTCDRDGLTGLYIDGKKQIDTETSPTSTLTSTGNLYIGRLASSGASFFDGELGDIKYWNKLLIDAEIKSFSSNPQVAIDWADTEANNTDLTSGTLIIGKRYRIDNYVATDDFTNVGAASNATGIEFIATGTTPTDWTNGSTLHQIGATFYLPGRNFGPIQAKDDMNGLIATNNGAQLANIDRNKQFQNEYFSIADDDTFDVPAECAMLEIMINVKTAQASTYIRIGTSDGGQEVVADSTTTQTVGPNMLIVLIPGFKDGDTLYIGSDGGDPWTTLEADLYVNYRLIKGMR